MTLQHVVDWRKRIARSYLSEFDQVRRTLGAIKEYFVTSESLQGIVDWHKRIAMMKMMDHRLFLPGDVFWATEDKMHSVYGVNSAGREIKDHLMYGEACTLLDLPDHMGMTSPGVLGNLGCILRARHLALTADKTKNARLGRMWMDGSPFLTSHYRIIDTELKEIGEIRMTTSDDEQDDSGKVMIGSQVIEVESFEQQRVYREVARAHPTKIPPWTNSIDCTITIVILAARFDFILDYEEVEHRDRKKED